MNNFSPTRRHVLAGLGAAAVALPFGGRAQSDRPVTLILPVSVGSGVDTITRSASEALAHALGQTVVVDNRPGAGGIIGTSAIVKSEPNGFTIGMVSNNHVVYPSVYKSVPFDPIADITPISVVGSTPFMLVVNPNTIKARNIQELVSELKASPDKYTYASSGNGTILHLAVEMFVHQAGASARHIPYRGVAPMMTDLIGGQVDFGVLSLPSVKKQVESGALLALGACGAKRMASMPDLPTIAEQGVTEYECDGWFAAVGPAGLSDKDVQRFHQALKTAFNAPAVQVSMKAQGNNIVNMPPKETAAFFRSEMAKYAAVVKASGLQPV